MAQPLHISETEAARRIRDGTKALEAVRQTERAPFVETTKFTDRNAMMILAYLDAFETLGDESARGFALKTTDLLLAGALGRDGRVRHATAGTESYVDGLLPDYVTLSDALIEAFQVTGSPRYLSAAEHVMDRTVSLLWDGTSGGFLDRQPGDGGAGLLAARDKPFIDTSLPGGNAVAARTLDRLYLLTSVDRWRDRAEKDACRLRRRCSRRGIVRRDLRDGRSRACGQAAAGGHHRTPPRRSDASDRRHRMADVPARPDRRVVQSSHDRGCLASAGCGGGGASVCQWPDAPRVCLRR